MNIIQKIKLSDFQYDDKLGLNRLPQSFRHLEEEYAYSDGEIENYILSSIKNASDISDGSDELMQKSKDWASYYHLGVGRSNVIRCLDLPSSSKVLELGSGCGAISRYLGEHFESVDCVEGSLLRAQITCERCRDLSNVKVFCSNIEHIEFEPIYDVVTLIGVLEYAPVYFSSHENPFNYFLEIAKSAIKPDGILVIAIENKIGLKYWSGCPEDHTGIIYDGIHGYPKSGTPATFSKKEIYKLLNDIGLNNTNICYAYPDYKFADVILSDQEDESELYLHNWIEIPFLSDSIRTYSFHEGLTLRTLSKAGLLREFANSFLIVARRSSEPVSAPDWVAKKYTTNRFKEHRCVTTLQLTPTTHVDKLRLSNNVDKTCCNTGDNTIKMSHTVGSSQWFKGDMLIFEIYDAFCQDKSEKIIFDIVDEYYAMLLRQFDTGKKDEDGVSLLNGCAIDCTLNNIIRGENGELIPIDLEWDAEQSIPADYVVYRCAVNDIIGAAQHPFNRRIIKNSGKFTFKILGSLFDNYGKCRHNKNRNMERQFSKITRGEIETKRFYNNGVFPVIKSAIVWKVVKTIWHKLPYYAQDKIKYILVKIRF